MGKSFTQVALGRAKVSEDLRVLAADTQELLRLTASASGEQLDVLRDRLVTQIGDLRARSRDTQAAGKAKCVGAAGSADAYVRGNPWQAVGVAVLSGIVLGALLTR